MGRRSRYRAGVRRDRRGFGAAHPFCAFVRHHRQVLPPRRSRSLDPARGPRSRHLRRAAVPARMRAAHVDPTRRHWRLGGDVSRRWRRSWEMPAKGLVCRGQGRHRLAGHRRFARGGQGRHTHQRRLAGHDRHRHPAARKAGAVHPQHSYGPGGASRTRWRRLCCSCSRTRHLTSMAPICGCRGRGSAVTHPPLCSPLGSL